MTCLLMSFVLSLAWSILIRSMGIPKSKNIQIQPFCFLSSASIIMRLGEYLKLWSTIKVSNHVQSHGCSMFMILVSGFPWINCIKNIGQLSILHRCRTWKGLRVFEVIGWTLSEILMQSPLGTPYLRLSRALPRGQNNLLISFLDPISHHDNASRAILF